MFWRWALASFSTWIVVFAASHTETSFATSRDDITSLSSSRSIGGFFKNALSFSSSFPRPVKTAKVRKPTVPKASMVTSTSAPSSIAANLGSNFSRPAGRAAAAAGQAEGAAGAAMRCCWFVYIVKGSTKTAKRPRSK